MKSAFSLSAFSLLLPGNDFGLACQIITKIFVQKISSSSSYKRTFLSFSKLFYYDSFYTEKYEGKCHWGNREDTRIKTKKTLLHKGMKKQDVKKHTILPYKPQLIKQTKINIIQLNKQQQLNKCISIKTSFHSNL